MRLRVFSDLHLEAYGAGRPIPECDADVIILAGDIAVGTDGLEWAASQFPKQEVIYVPGNHEFYGGAMSSVRDDLAQSAKRLGIHLLDNDSLVLEGVTFYGTTLWSDFDLYKGREGTKLHHLKPLAEEKIPDFQQIEYPEKSRFTVEAFQSLHAKAFLWLSAELAKPAQGKCVVISHHAPLELCIPEQYQGHPLSPAFATNLVRLMGRMDLWVHGHIHQPVDLHCKGTRVFSNPGGYPDEFEPALLDEQGVITL